MARTGFAIGMPTDVDVKRLIEILGIPEPGQRIAYEAVEAVLKVTHQSPRFRTVTAAWRRKLEREQNLILSAVPNEGYDVLTNEGRVGHVSKLFKQGMRRTGVAGRRAASTSRDGLPAASVRVLDHVTLTSALFKTQAALEARKLRELPPASKS